MSRNAWYWALYDFANSVVFIVFIFYFPQWLVITKHHPAWWFNATLVVSSLLFILAAPSVSARIDSQQKKLRGLRFWTAVSLAIFAIVSFLTLFAHSLDAVTAVLYTLGMFAYLMCFLYFTPMLNDLSTPQNRARISGVGMGFNLAGQVAGLLLTIPIINGSISFFGADSFAETFLPSVIGMALLSVPMLFLYKEETRELSSSVPVLNTGIKMFLKRIAANKPLMWLLLAYFFFVDALLTFANNFPLYLEKVYDTPEVTRSLLSIAILALGAIGGVVFGTFADTRGHKKTMIGLLAVWVCLFTGAALIRDFNTIVPLFLLGGVVFGPVWSVTRAMVGQLATADTIASSYSLYNIAERFSTFIGPITWSSVLLVVGENVGGYQGAIFSMGILTLIGLLILLKVPETKEPNRSAV